MLIDTHCHLASFAQRGDVPGVLDRAAAAGVSRVITIGTSTDDWELYAGLAAAYPSRVDYTVGLHPCDVANDDSWRAQLEKLPAFFQRPPAAGPSPVALGEIGLDRFHLPKDPAAAASLYACQEAAFRAQLAFARTLSCPIVIHSRDSFADCVRVIDDSGVPWPRFVFHCFTHGPDELRLLAQRGARASFTGIITYKNADPIRAALLAQNVDSLMIETDAPYLAPVPHRGQANEPAFLRHTAEAAGRVLNLSLDELSIRTTANARKFFNLPDGGRR